jgi:FMN-dependent NADH-azoreductase
MDITPGIREEAVALAIDQARTMASRPDWAAVTADRRLVNPPGLKPQPLVAEDEDASVAP